MEYGFTFFLGVKDVKNHQTGTTATWNRKQGIDPEIAIPFRKEKKSHPKLQINTTLEDQSRPSHLLSEAELDV